MRRMVLLMAVVAIGGAAEARAQVATVELSPARTSLVAGDSLRLTLVARDRAGALVTATQPFWGVGPFEVATVTQDGLVRTFRRGSVKVVVRAGGKTATADIEVLPKPAA
ncbi:MAG: hypothetical protein JNJ80_18365, partial [Gemmatimonadetes bacterium]|nr:hypothetical protein [Gemmatimonadota bacterium]